MISYHLLHRIIVGVGLFVIPASVHAQVSTTRPSLVKLSAEQDHRRMLDLLGIKEIRRGADGDPNSPRAANRDETKANPFPDLPDPLTANDGTKITTAKLWWEKRRPEIVEDFDREVYGRIPSDLPAVTWEITKISNENKGKIPVVVRKLIGHVDNSRCPEIAVKIDLTITTPADVKGPVPLMMEFGFNFRPRPASGPGTQPASRPATRAATQPQGPDWQEQVLSQGWATAVIIPTSYQADNAQGLTEGIIGLVNLGQPRKVDDWGVLRAWAWGASRAMDYFETDPLIDAKRVGIEGLSRYGKAALVTMAYDDRFAIGFIASSGAGGAKLHRRDFGEKVENLAGMGAYHWMAGNYIKYAGPFNASHLPVDSHELIALCAPRPVFISAGSLEVEGGWIDAKGMFMAEVAAGPVYRLLGKKDLGTSEIPTQETGLTDGDLAFRQHAVGHTAGPNWPVFIPFASRYFDQK